MVTLRNSKSIMTSKSKSIMILLKTTMVAMMILKKQGQEEESTLIGRMIKPVVQLER